jgi:hypothetical protein
MTKKYPSGNCVHCLKHFNKLTADHVFPESWYPETTPLDIEKWKIPSCLKCNHEYGKLEEDLLWRLGLSVDPKDQKSLGITDKVLRSTNPKYAKNERDRLMRAAKLASIVKQLKVSNSVPQKGLLPNFGPQANLHYNGYVAIPISEENIVKLGQKIVRGITYIYNNALITEDYSINVYVIEDYKAQEVLKTIETFGVVQDRGPGIVVKYALTSEGGLSSLWYIEIWGRFKLYAVVIPKQGVSDAIT